MWKMLRLLANLFTVAIVQKTKHHEEAA